jgi:hypothetical protein
MTEVDWDKWYQQTLKSNRKGEANANAGNLFQNL